MKAAKLLSLAVVLTLSGAAVYLLFGRDTGPAITLTDARAAPIAGVPGAVGVFLKIDNPGGPDTLTGASSARARSARIDGPWPTLAIPAGSTPSLAPDGAFLRLDGVAGDLADGQLIPVTVMFDKAGPLSLQARLVAPRETGAAHDFGLFGLGDICLVGEGEPAPQIALTAGAAGGGWNVAVEAVDFTFEPDMADGPHIPGTGHGHLYLNGLKLQRLYGPEARIGALPAGRHEVTVTLNTNDHRAYVVDDLPVTASATITAR